MLLFIIIFLKNKSDTCERKTFLVSLSFVSLVATSFCIHQAQTENNVGHHSEIISQGHCKNEYKEYCWNEGESYYLVDEVILNCNGTWLWAGKRCEKYMWWARLKMKIRKTKKFWFNVRRGEKIHIKIWKVAKVLFQNPTMRNIFNSKSDAVFFLEIKFWHVVKFPLRNHASKNHNKSKICPFHGVKWRKTWLSESNFFLHVVNFFISN